MISDYFRMLKDLVVQIAGKDTEALVDILKSGKPINEFKIAEKLKLTINQTRNILYKLSNQSIVFFVRKKDEKKGWYIYSWSLNISKALEKLKFFKEKEINQLRHQLNSRENKRFYKCPNECIEFNEESAMLHNFACPECGSILNLASTEELERELKAKIDCLQKEVAEINVEIHKLNEARLAEIEKERVARRKRQKIARKAAKRKAERLRTKMKPNRKSSHVPKKSNKKTRLSKKKR